MSKIIIFKIQKPNTQIKYFLSPFSNITVTWQSVPARKPTSISSCPPQAEDSFYPPKMENPSHFLLLWSQPKTEFQRNSFLGELRSYSSSGVFLSSTKNRWFSSFPPLVENPSHSLCLRRVLQKRSSVGIPFKES